MIGKVPKHSIKGRSTYCYKDNEFLGFAQRTAIDRPAAYRTSGKWAKLIPEQAWQRIGIHTEAGAVSLSQMLDKYIGHLEDHLVFIAKKRGSASR